MLRKPTNYLTVYQESSTLKISPSRESRLYFTYLFTGLCLFNLILLMTWDLVSESPSPFVFEWWLIQILAILIGIGPLPLILYFLWKAPAWSFDGQNNQLHLGDKLMGKLQDVRGLILKAEQGNDGKMWHILSISRQDTPPCLLYRQEGSEELYEMAHRIARFIGVPVSVLPADKKRPDLMSLADTPWWVQVLASVGGTGALCGPLILVITICDATPTEKIACLAATPLLVAICITLLFLRGKRIAATEFDAQEQADMMKKLRREFQQSLLIAVPASLACVALVAWLIPR